MVFRRDNKPEFQRQMGALRQQLGSTEEGGELPPEHHADPRHAEAAYAAPPSRESFAPVREPGGYVPGSSYAAPPAVPEPAVPVVPGVDAHTSIIAADTTWRGDLDSHGSIHVHGRVEGTIIAANEIYIADQAEVDARLTAAIVIIAGKVTGEVVCSQRFEMLPTGRVDGNIQSPSLVVHEGASITGQFRMGTPEPATDSRVSSVMGRRAARGTA